MFTPLSRSVFVGFLAVSAALAGCATTAPGTVLTAPQSRPAVTATGRATAPVQVLSLDLSGVDTRLGWHNPVGGKSQMAPLFATEADLALWQNAMTAETTAALQSAGYVAETVPQRFAGDAPVTRHRFGLAGKVTRLAAHHTGSGSGGHTNADVEVSWEVYDTKSQKVVLTTTTASTAATAGKTLVAVPLAFRGALSELLADERLVTAMATP
jgi:hypothetical protein